MPEMLTLASMNLLGISSAVSEWLNSAWGLLMIILGFSAIIFVHELGHFMAAKWAGVRVEKFCIGFGKELFGFTRGETRYGFNVLPLGGYVKMMGQEDFDIDKSGEILVKDDPRAFSNKSVGKRMIIVSAGVVMNVLFAAVLFMIVFMIGKELPVTEIGTVIPGSRADQAGLQVGDVIKQIDGERMNDFHEVQMAIMLARPHEELDFVVDRQGQDVTLKVLPENAQDNKLLAVGIGPAMDRTIVAVGNEYEDAGPDAPHVGDVIVSVAGLPVTDENANEVLYRLLSRPGPKRNIVVERPIESDGSEAVERREIAFQPSVILIPDDPTDPTSVHVLGLKPLVQIDYVDPGSRAEAAGLKPGDAILNWDGTDFPTKREIEESIVKNAEIDLPVHVLRGTDERVKLAIRPQKPSGWLKRGQPPRIGAVMNPLADDVMVIGRPVKSIDGHASPAIQAGLPGGAKLTRVGDTQVDTWTDLVNALYRHADSSVDIAYVDATGESKTTSFAVPPSLRTVLGMPIYSKILAINDDRQVEIEVNNRRRRLSVSYPYALREVLKRNVGKTIDVTYAESIYSQKQTAQVEVRPEMVDPWPGRIGFDVAIIPGAKTALLRTSNPITALGIGVKKTIYFLNNVYVTIQRMLVSRSVGIENVSGPVGIIKMGAESAKQGIGQLLFLLAILSANLAVINFLPLPIVDGGLMIFLIIEKIKGSPVSVKTQAVTQMVGLAMIVLMFVYITFQDVIKIATGEL